ncbi:GFA family protein [Methylotetracoccus oryzae]|uniref:GFA family protein n=1 Tax=Methylotetracoccus oryzae TaxID=1919059 RepID=UPI001118E2DA|nr:GFA family protein [Methylotetracoccus oryzae]
MSKRYSGSCLCGEVRFEVDGEFERFYLCHCEHCRKDTGSGHAANLFSSTARLSWTAGAEKATSFNLPGTRHRKCFCSICGSALPYETGDMLVVPAGSLDVPVALRPDAHLFVASRAVWDQNFDTVPAFDRLPP